MSDKDTLNELLQKVRLAAFDFDGVFTDNTVYVFEDGREAVSCSRADGLGLQKLRNAGIETIVISTETNPVVSARCRKLGIRVVQSCQDKRRTLEMLAEQLEIPFSQIMFVGNDINDLACLTCVGLPVVVQDAHPDVLSNSRYRTKTPGGKGAVREICDLIINVRERETTSTV